MPETTVIHINDAPPGWEKDQKYQYIGRAWSSYPKGSPFACRYRSAEFPKGEALARYEDDLKNNLEDPQFLKKLKALHGKILVCYEKPNHGEILARWAKKLADPSPLEPIGPVVHLLHEDVVSTQENLDSWVEFEKIEWQFKQEYEERLKEEIKKFQENKAFISSARDMVDLLRPITQFPPFDRYKTYADWRNFLSAKE